MQIPVHNISGDVIKSVELDDSVFGTSINIGVVHQAMVAQRRNNQQGTINTKTRSQVIGSRRKLYRQKGTGNARAGSIKSPLRRGGGVIFGPHPRDLSQILPKKMRQLAIRCLLSSKIEEGNLVVVDNLNTSEKKTKKMALLLTALKVKKPVLIALANITGEKIASLRNLKDVTVIPGYQLNVLDLLEHKSVVMTEEVVKDAEKLWKTKKPTGEVDASV